MQLGPRSCSPLTEGVPRWANDSITSRSEGLKPQLRSYFESVEDIVDDFIQVVKHFSQQHPGVPVVLLGQSLGGCIAVRAAEKAPKLATVLVRAKLFRMLVLPPIFLIARIALLSRLPWLPCSP
eukprot:scaffold207_cov409-Prasinococcus_capsulatus_cf.AAC.100